LKEDPGVKPIDRNRLLPLLHWLGLLRSDLYKLWQHFYFRKPYPDRPAANLNWLDEHHRWYDEPHNRHDVHREIQNNPPGYLTSGGFFY